MDITVDRNGSVLIVELSFTKIVGWYTVYLHSNIKQLYLKVHTTNIYVHLATPITSEK